MIELYLRESTDPGSQAAETLLEEILGERGIFQPERLVGPHGKPYLENGPEFNLSHTRGVVAVAVSESPVGLDIERLRPYLPSLPKRVLSPGERSWFSGRGERPEDFFTLWTLKESYLKFLGTGLRGIPNETEFYYDGQWHLRNSALWFWTFAEKDLRVALCGDAQCEVTYHWR